MSGSSPASVMREIGCASPPAQIRQVRAGASLRGVERRFLAYAFPPRSPHPRRLAVPTRHGFVRAACHPSRHLPEQAAPSFTAPLRRDGGEGLSPPLNQQAPHAAPAERRSPRMTRDGRQPGWLLKPAVVGAGSAPRRRGYSLARVLTVGLPKGGTDVGLGTKQRTSDPGCDCD